MKKRLTIVALAVAVVALIANGAFAGPLPKPVSKNVEAQKLIDEAWNLYKSKSDAETYKKCAELMEKADKLDPNNEMILTDLSRYYWNWGDSLPKQTEEQQKTNVALFEKGVEAAEKSLKVKATAGGHYWLAVNTAASKEFSNIMAQAAAFPGIKKNSDKSKELDPDYYYGGPGRLWSEVINRVPKKVVEIVGWDIQEAINEIDAAIKKAPLFIDNYVYKARFFNAYFGKKDEALALIDQAMKIDPKAMPDELCANTTAQEEGKALWKQITTKDYPNK